MKHLEKRNDGLSVILCCNKFGWSVSRNLSRDWFQAIVAALAVFVVAALASFYFSYTLHGESEEVLTQKNSEINELLDAVEAMSHEVVVDRRLEQKFIDRVLTIEKKLASMERRLSAKSSRKRPPMGGRGFGADDISHDYFVAIEKDMKKLSGTMAATPLGKPARGSISSGYGYRKSPFSNAREFHGGMDFRGNPGDSVVATADGVVVKAKRVKGYGKHVIVRHKKGYKTLYAHLSKITVRKGQKVVSGQKLGEIGSTGRSSGPHLHYEISRYGSRINPKKFVNLR